jgi:aminoglycoside phosphotransferase family enzyme
MKNGQDIHDTEQASLVLIEGLRCANAFPHEVHNLELIETHISWIVLTGKFAYKIKKPLDLGFLNFSTLELRQHYCREELRLNRRFSPQLYLDVVPIGGTREHPMIDQEPAIEWAVRMHQFPADQSLDRQLATQNVSVADMHRLGETVAAAHGAAESAVGNEYGTLASILDPALENFHSPDQRSRHSSVLDEITVLREWTKTEAGRLERVFSGRVLDAYIRECHGDLHAGNIVRLNGEFFPLTALSLIRNCVGWTS